MKPKGKRNLSDQLSRRSHRAERGANNPFELFLTKAKHNITGRTTNNAKNAAVLSKLQGVKKSQGKANKVQIHTQGLRSVSRSTALENRKKGLLNEYKTRSKNNKMIDKRLGERDATMSVEDKMLERVMFERKKNARTKRGLFNLNEVELDEDLAFGQSLADAERIEDHEKEPTPDDVDDQLGGKFVAEHHFGGGLLKKVPEPQIGDYNKQVKMTREERKLLVEDIIAESKQKKYAKQTELDEIRDMTQSLDAKWADVEMRNLISSTFNQPVLEPQADSYDSLVKMLHFDKKAKGSDKLKNESELAKEEKDFLEEAEKKRQKSDIPMEKAEAQFSSKIVGIASSRGLEMLEPEIEDVYFHDKEASSDVDSEDLAETSPKFIASIEKYPDIPFVIEIPKKLSHLQNLLKNRNPEACLVIINRIVKYHHISLAEENRWKLSAFVCLLLDYLLDKMESEPVASTELWKVLTPSLHELFTISTEKGIEFMKSRLEVLSSLVCGPKRFSLVPSALIFLKFTSICFPPDLQNPVTEAMFLLLGKLLVRLPLNDRKSYLYSDFVATLAAEYCSLTKRYCPELINHFQRIFLMEMENSVSLSGNWTPNMICLSQVFAIDDGQPITPLDRMQTLDLSVSLIGMLVEPFAELPAYDEIFGPLIQSLRKLCEKVHLEHLKEKSQALEELIQKFRKRRPYLTFFKKMPPPLKLLEPRLDNKFEKAKFSEKSVIKRLAHDKKRALKGAKRELRRDNQFISRIQMEEQTKKDAVRRRKVKEIYTGLYTQQSEHKALQRQKAKFKV